MLRSDSIKELAAALSKAQSRFRIAEFDCINPHFKSKYASLTSVMNVVRAPLSENGLSLVQTVEQDANGDMFLDTTLFHASGEWVSGRMPLILSKQDMQGLGSAVTYAKRYAIAAMVGVVSDEDDDGNAVSTSPRIAPPRPRPGAKTLPVPKPEPKEHVLEVVSGEGELVALERLARLRKIMEASGWQPSDAKAYTSNKYGKMSSRDLSEAELEEFTNYVKLHPKTKTEEIDVKGTDPTRTH